MTCTDQPPILQAEAFLGTVNTHGSAAAPGAGLGREQVSKMPQLIRKQTTERAGSGPTVFPLEAQARVCMKSATAKK